MPEVLTDTPGTSSSQVNTGWDVQNAHGHAYLFRERSNTGSSVGRRRQQKRHLAHVQLPAERPRGQAFREPEVNVYFCEL